jgi:hypothetical protein
MKNALVQAKDIQGFVLKILSIAKTADRQSY